MAGGGASHPGALLGGGVAPATHPRQKAEGGGGGGVGGASLLAEAEQLGCGTAKWGANKAGAVVCGAPVPQWHGRGAMVACAAMLGDGASHPGAPKRTI